MTFGLDLGYFDEAIWKISQGKFPYSGVGCIWLLEDHFQPILYLIAPLYRIWPNVRLLLIIQSLMMVLAAVPLYLTARIISRNLLFSLAVSAAYLFFIGTQFSILNEFHQVTLAPLFLSLAFYFLTLKNIRGFILSSLVLFFIKEDLSLLVSALGFGLLLGTKYKKAGILLISSGAVFFFALIYLILPKLSVLGVYSHLDFGAIGRTPLDIVGKMIGNPLLIFSVFFDSTVKLRTIFLSLYNFSFLPVFSGPFYLIVLFEDFFTRFIYYGPQTTKWALVNHHSAVSAIVLPFASIFGARWIIGRFKGKLNYGLFTGLLIFTTATQMVIVHAPVFSIFKSDFYKTYAWMEDNRKVMKLIPPTASLAANNSLLPHLTQRDDIYRLPFGQNSQYIMVDLEDGPNKYAPLQYAEMKSLIDSMIDTGKFSVIAQSGQAFLLKRNFKTDISKDKYYQDRRYCYYSFEER